MNTQTLETRYRRIAEALEQTGGVIEPEIAKELNSVDFRAWEKADPIIDLIKIAEADEAAADAEAAPILARAKRSKRTADNLKVWLLSRMLALQVRHLEGPRHECRTQASPDKIEWPGKPDTIPIPFRRVKTELDPNAVKLANVQGVDLKALGFTVEDNRRHLVIVL